MEKNTILHWIDLRETDIPEELLIKINRMLEKNRQKMDGSQVFSSAVPSIEREILESGQMTPAQLTEDQVSAVTEITVG